MPDDNAASTSTRHTALVIGNAAYTGVASLSNPTNDADDVAAVLDERGFSVIKKTNCSHKEMDVVLKEFRIALKSSEVGLFFFAGHGIQIDGENYLAAVDADASNEIDAKHSSLALNRVIETMEKSGTATNIIILDACRDNPFERAWHRSAAQRGLAPVYAPKGTIIAYATSPGQIASDGEGHNGAYTAALLKHIDTPDCSLEMMFKRVRNTLSAATKGKQISWEHTSLACEFFFNLSLGARVDEYSDTALSDHLFVLDDSKQSHRLIQGLKTHDWYQQNPALEKLTPDIANKARKDSVFVLGRNIYQAACGYSRTAIDFLSNFMAKTSGFTEDHRKALLDGMLFEIFFDKRARLREQPKIERMDLVFDLQDYKELSTSFAFIAECSLTHPGHFHVIPGKGRTVTVDIVTKKKSADKYIVKEIRFNGADILWVDKESINPAFSSASGMREMSVKQFEKLLCEEMVVPARLLKVTYTFEHESKSRILFPEGGTVRKRA
jgi:uncharacterized caspase-like protein